MHELSIALGILDVASEEVRRRGCGRVMAIHVRIGPLSGIVPAALRSAYELAREGSEMPSADLVVEEISLEAFCPRCAASCTPVSASDLCCPSCGSPTPKVTRGTELEVTALEVES